MQISIRMKKLKPDNDERVDFGRVKYLVKKKMLTMNLMHFGPIM